MPRNVEIKARVDDFDEFLQRAKSLCGDNSTPTILDQTDTFFYSQKGRLKLREQSSSEGTSSTELILYERPDLEGPKVCNFTKVVVDDAAGMKTILEKSNGITGLLVKRRYLLIYAGYVRIHADKVKGLGEFAELEVSNSYFTNGGLNARECVFRALGLPKT